jgi:microsomal dipeptidase-like Zn-dependent dipeptidase
MTRGLMYISCMLAVVGLAGCLGGGDATGNSDSRIQPRQNSASLDRFNIANQCFSVSSADGQFLDKTGGQYTLSSQPAPFYFKPSRLGQYLLFDRDSGFLGLSNSNPMNQAQLVQFLRTGTDFLSGLGDMTEVIEPAKPLSDGVRKVGETLGKAIMEQSAASSRDTVPTAQAEPGFLTVWEILPSTRQNSFRFRQLVTGQFLAAEGGVLGLVERESESGIFELKPASACAAFPEAELNASGTPFKGTTTDGQVVGWVDTHIHIGGSEALGGKLAHGRPFHPFGITKALNSCEADHGPRGTLGVLDNLLATGSPVNQHATDGWPTFSYWPNPRSQTHHQTYYMWMKRAWMGGQRIMVNHFVANEVICQVWPLKEHDCDEMESIKLQRQLLLDLEEYIDAQEGGPGKGWFRIVYDSATARRVIADGKLAVVMGTENEKLFNCGEFMGMPECTEQQVLERLDELYAMGIRSVFPLHIFDNAFGGTEISRFTKDAALMQVFNAGNIWETGHPFASTSCEEIDKAEPSTVDSKDYGLFELALLQLMNIPPTPEDVPGRECQRNARGLTKLGDFLIGALANKGVMVETDHMSALSRKRVLAMMKERGLPVVSGHSGTISAARDSQRIVDSGGLISNLPDEPSPAAVDYIQKLSALYPPGKAPASGFGSDINGIHQQADPRLDAGEKPLVYPFKSPMGDVVFDRQKTGDRVYDLNTDGVAHYGLYPDYIADMMMQPGGKPAVATLFRSAEAYLKMWEKVENYSRQK